MQYFIEGLAWVLWIDIQKFAESVECDLWPTEQSDNSFGMGKEPRVNIVRRGVKPPQRATGGHATGARNCVAGDGPTILAAPGSGFRQGGIHRLQGFVTAASPE